MRHPLSSRTLRRMFREHEVGKQLAQLKREGHFVSLDGNGHVLVMNSRTGKQARFSTTGSAPMRRLKAVIRGLEA
jgi:hypothetical protein